ncbi:class I SAM-dependent methyltransferase [Microtetraspora niveoalba]|uniref:class I SAM-dependent methyltransferase n=1 Tax=Microtetraspora niveoalba TaxID=46175 RepID=UPI0008311F82|nr:methyltransferase domain-containing protein [Microtetraspora niveoalba]
MGAGKLSHLHSKHGDGGGTIDHPRGYEVLAEIGFAGRRRSVFRRLAALSGAGPGHRILDVGCGTGYLTRLLAPLVGPDGRVTGVDPSRPMLDHARRRSPGNCSYQVGEGQALPFPDASFDIAVSSFAVHHMPGSGRPAAMAEMFRVLRPGGRLLIAEFRPPGNPLAARLVGLLAGAAMRPAMPDLLADLVPDAGFRVEDTGTVGPVLYYVSAVRPLEPRS